MAAADARCAGGTFADTEALFVNIYQFAIMLLGLLFGGHSLLHRWDQRTTRRGLMKRACHWPEFVARAWLEGAEDVKSPRLWLQFKGGKPYVVAHGRKGCAEAIARLTAAGIEVDGGGGGAGERLG